MGDLGKKGNTLRQTATQYGVSKTTLSRHERGELKGQPVEILNLAEEEVLCIYIKYMQERAMPLTTKNGKGMYAL